MSSEPSLRGELDETVSLAFVDMEGRIRDGDSWDSEAFLAAHPEIAADAARVVEFLLNEYCVRRRLGQALDPHEWFSRFPRWKHLLERRLQTMPTVDGPPETPDAAAQTVEHQQRSSPSGGETVPELGRHEVYEEIGRGVFGVVHRARDVIHDRIVALKQLAPGLPRADEIPLFFREVRAAVLVRHPHLLPLFAAGLHQGRPCFTMQLAVNGSLAERRGQFTDPRTAADLVEKLARAVAAAHAHGLLHGRLTPGRVAFDENGQPRVGGFGLLSFLSSKSDSGMVCIGNPAYCAPEQLAARPDALEAATDVWALGIMLYELLTGRLPFNAVGGVETIRSIQSNDPVRPHQLRLDLDRTLEAILLRCLQKQPDDRYPSARALADDLERWQRAEPTVARPETLTQRILRGLSRTLRGKPP